MRKHFLLAFSLFIGIFRPQGAGKDAGSPGLCGAGASVDGGGVRVGAAGGLT